MSLLKFAELCSKHTLAEERRPQALDSTLQGGPRDGIGQQRHIHQADRFASRKAIRRNHMESPLARVAVIGARVHDRVMREDVDMGEASGISDPIRALEISGSRPNIEYRHCRLSRSCPRLPSRRLLYFQEQAGGVLEIPTAPIARAQSPFGAERRAYDDFGHEPAIDVRNKGHQMQRR